MARYRIWCRTAEAGTDLYMATVCVVPAGADAAGALESETRTFPTLAMAREHCAEMAAKMRDRVMARGDVIDETVFV
jgi:hypothetical protein